MKTIEIQKIKFSYPQSKNPVLDIENFNLDQGERAFLFGPSGCGKTTFLEVLAGVLIPQQGQVKICNTEIQMLTPSARDAFRAAHVGYIFQSFNLIPYLNVRENISLPLNLSAARRVQVPHDKEAIEIEFLCRELGILDLLEQPITELSVGQQQRVAAARALLGQPQLILADEPTSSLDFDQREKFIQLLFSLCQKNKISVLFVSHDRSLQGLFDRAISLAEMNKVGRL